MKKNKSKKSSEKVQTHSCGSSTWMITSIVLAVLLIASLLFILLGSNSGGDALSQNRAEARANEFINLLSDPQNPLRISSVEEDTGLYRIAINLQGQTETWYMSLNGNYLAPQVFTMDQIRTLVGGQQPPVDTQPPPQAQVNVNLEGANTLGSGSVLMVEYSSATCPFCARFATETFPLINSEYIETGEITYVYKHYIRNDVDVLAANAMECAGEQGAFFEFKNVVYANQNSLAQRAIYSTWADNLGLDVDAFDACVDEGRYSAKATADTQEGQGNGVTGTPGFLINSRLIAGAQPFANFQAAIDAELAI